jgi:hypothetical protein
VTKTHAKWQKLLENRRLFRSNYPKIQSESFDRRKCKHIVPNSHCEECRPYLDWRNEQK